MDADARVESVYSSEFAIPLDITRLRYVERGVRSSQLAVTHELSSRHRLEYALTTSGVIRREPDRSEIAYQRFEDEPNRAPEWMAVAIEGAVRTYGALEESALEGKVDYRYMLSEGATPRSIKVGALVRGVDRDATNRSYAITAFGLTSEQRALRPEQIFDGRFSETGQQHFRINPMSAGGSYAATDRLAAGYVMGDVALTPRVQVIAGVRYEDSRVTVRSENPAGAITETAPEYSDLLPALALTLRLGDYQNLRFAASQTLTRPEYRELSPIQYRVVLGGDNVAGDDNLRRSLIQNYDVRWEWYPSESEVYTVSVFAKRFKDPIERVYLGTSGTRLVTFQNARGADNLGVELEVRKWLGRFTPALDPWLVFSNVKVMRSEIRLKPGSASITNADRSMAGQAPYVVNVGVTYTAPDAGASATLLFNQVGERIVDAGILPLPDVVEQSRSALDFSLRYPLLENVSLKFDAKNLLDSPFEIRQGSAVREAYRTGRGFSFGVNWRN
jgi:TonB-dependent receptor